MECITIVRGAHGGAPLQLHQSSIDHSSSPSGSGAGWMQVLSSSMCLFSLEASWMAFRMSTTWYTISPRGPVRPAIANAHSHISDTHAAAVAVVAVLALHLHQFPAVSFAQVD